MPDTSLLTGQGEHKIYRAVKGGSRDPHSCGRKKRVLIMNGLQPGSDTTRIRSRVRKPSYNPIAFLLSREEKHKLRSNPIREGVIVHADVLTKVKPPA